MGSAGVCVVTGAGPASGRAFAGKFASAGYRVALLARSPESLSELASEIAGTKAYPTDVTDVEALRATFAAIRSELGPVRVLIHNAGNASFGDFAQITPEQMEQAWRINALALLVCAQEVAPSMVEAGEGAILVTGATASLRGGAGFAAFAPAKAAQRSLAQSMARTLGPQGVHVTYIIVDGVIDTPVTRTFLSDRPDEHFLKPNAIAETYYWLVCQDRSAWTFEVDVRPYSEQW